MLLTRQFTNAVRSVLVTYKLAENGTAHVAQLVERVLGKDEVTGSIPVMGSESGVLQNDLMNDISSKSRRRP